MNTSEFWNKKYIAKTTGWDIGGVSKPLVEYIDQLEDKNIKVLFPGAGHAYDAEYMYNAGFKNVYVVDVAQAAADAFLKRVPHFPKNQFLVSDFFTLSESFDLIIEQTFYCAIPPALRDDYVKKMYEILNPSGKLAGVLFTFPLTENGPPFGGSMEEYRERFSNKFIIRTLAKCNNSIESRMGNEAFVILEKPVGE